MLTGRGKVYIIEAALKTEDENIPSEVEKTINKSDMMKHKISAFDFVGTLNKRMRN